MGGSESRRGVRGRANGKQSEERGEKKKKMKLVKGAKENKQRSGGREA